MTRFQKALKEIEAFLKEAEQFNHHSNLPQEERTQLLKRARELLALKEKVYKHMQWVDNYVGVMDEEIYFHGQIPPKISNTESFALFKKLDPKAKKYLNTSEGQKEKLKDLLEIKKWPVQKLTLKDLAPYGIGYNRHNMHDGSLGDIGPEVEYWQEFYLLPYKYQRYNLFQNYIDFKIEKTEKYIAALVAHEKEVKLKLKNIGKKQRRYRLAHQKKVAEEKKRSDEVNRKKREEVARKNAEIKRKYKQEQELKRKKYLEQRKKEKANEWKEYVRAINNYLKGNLTAKYNPKDPAFIKEATAFLRKIMKHSIYQKAAKEVAKGLGIKL